MEVKNLTNNRRIILGSISPRRKELLSCLDIDFTIEAQSGAVEYYSEDIPYSLVPQSIAEQKSLSFHRPLKDDELLITADTLVFCPDKSHLGKPIDNDDARRMLRLLSGKTHEVITGVCIRTTDKKILFSDISFVTFKVLSEDEINYYVEKYSPLDKAGAYAIQEWIGYIGITSITGSFHNVMGLPIQKLYEKLLTI